MENIWKDLQFPSFEVEVAAVVFHPEAFNGTFSITGLQTI